MRAARAGPRRRKLARHSRGVLPFLPTRPSSRTNAPFQPDIIDSGKRWMRSPKIAVHEARWKNTASSSANEPRKIAWSMSAAQAGSGSSLSSASKRSSGFFRARPGGACRRAAGQRSDHSRRKRWCSLFGETMWRTGPIASTSRASSPVNATGDHTHTLASESRATAIRVGYGKPKNETVGPSAR